MSTVDTKTKLEELRELAVQIRKARLNAHLSQAKLGENIGVSDKSISSYEKGRSTPPFDKLKKIAQYTNHPLTFFTDDNQEIEATVMNKLTTIQKELENIKKLLSSAEKLPLDKL